MEKVVKVWVIPLCSPPQPIHSPPFPALLHTPGHINVPLPFQLLVGITQWGALAGEEGEERRDWRMFPSCNTAAWLLWPWTEGSPAHLAPGSVPLSLASSEGGQ